MTFKKKKKTWIRKYKIHCDSNDVRLVKRDSISDCQFTDYVGVSHIWRNLDIGIAVISNHVNPRI